MSTEDNPTSKMTPEERSSIMMDFLHNDALSIACRSGNEQKVRSLLSENDYTDCFKSSKGYGLLCVTLSFLYQKLEDRDSRLNENYKSKFIMICKLLLEHEAKVNDEETYLKFNTTPLHLAVKIENDEIVKLLLAKGAGVNIRKYGFSPLHLAVWNNSTHIVQLLLENRADTQNHDSETPLQTCVFKSFGNIAHHFFLENVDNLYNSNNDEIDEHSEIRSFSPLQIVSAKKKKKFMKMQVPKGLDVNAKTGNGDTPLHYAVFKDSKTMAQLLLENGADPDICNKRGRKPFDYYKSRGMKIFYTQYRIKTYLDKGGSVEAKDEEGYTLLHHAVKYKSEEAISLLLDRGCDVNAVSNLGESPLHLAVRADNKNVTLLLLQNGCNVNATTNTGCTALHLAADHNRAKSLKILKILIKNGADIKLKNKFGLTALNYAVKRQSCKKVQVLLGENPETSDKELKLAFCLSFVDHEYRNGRCKLYLDADTRLYTCLCKVFFDFGFTVHVEDFNDMYIPTELYSDWLSETADEKFRSMVQTFLHKQATSDTNSISKLLLEFQVLVGAVRHGFVEIFFNLLKPYMDVNSRLRDGNTLLHCAMNPDNLTIIEELFRRGAAVNALNDKCKSPLYISIFDGCLKVIRFLLENGADCEARDEDNYTPLLIATSEAPNFDIARLLLEYGANVNCIISNEKLCPLHMAVDYCKKDIAKLLLHYGAFVDPSDSLKIKPLFQVWDYIFLFPDVDIEVLDDCLEMIDLMFNYGAKTIELHPDMFENPNECAMYKVKSLAANFEDFNFSIDSSEVAEFQSECLEEVARMKSMKIAGFNISVYDLLVKPQRQSAMYMRNANVVKMLDSMDFGKKFPIYAGKLSVCVMRGRLENRLLELCYECLDVILKRKLPYVVVGEIISYLNTSDLHRLIIASPIATKKKSSVKYPFIIQSLDE